jgi:hypothetical protein
MDTINNLVMSKMTNALHYVILNNMPFFIVKSTSLAIYFD